MNWEVNTAKQQFSDLINAVAQEPQLIYDQTQLVAVVVEAEVFQEFLAWRKQQKKPSVADAIKELRQIIEEENYTLEISPRQDRSNPFADCINDKCK
ncbi:prevent-host-death protein [Nostoc sp. NIES-2111]